MNISLSAFAPENLYHVEEKPTVKLYTYINRHAGTRDKTKTKYMMSLDYNLLH